MPQIEFDHVSKYFMNEKRRFAAIDELSLSIEAGDFVFLIGSSGAGKTTLLRLLANHITPEEGCHMGGRAADQPYTTVAASIVPPPDWAGVAGTSPHS